MSQPAFKPANKLEEVLVAACAEPSARPEFYRMLLESELFLLTPDAPQEEGRRVLETETKVSFVHLQNANGPFLPIFSSQQRLQDAVNQKSEEPPHLIIGIECDGDMQKISQEAGITSQGLLGEGEFVDFIQVGSGKGSLDSYFKKQTKPFYQSAAKKPFWKVW